jgi:DNA-binding MarR family transcriptional regulator
MTTLSPRSEALVDLWLVSERLSAKADHHIGAVHGIGYVEFLVLLQLSKAPDCRMRRVDLAGAVGRTASGVTRLLKPMEKIGLVARDSSERDARVSLVALSDAGKERLTDALQTLDSVAERLLLPLGDATLDSMRSGLALLREI